MSGCWTDFAESVKAPWRAISTPEDWKHQAPRGFSKMRIGKSTLRLRSLLLALILTLISISGLRAQDIVVSIPPQQEMIEALCDAHVETLIGPGQSPESWSPTPGTIVRIVSSDLYVPIGLPFETSLKRKLEEIAPKLKICIEGIPARSEDSLDPHVWLDPEGAVKHARAVASCLKSLPGIESSRIDSRLAAYTERLRESEDKAAKLLAPYSGRTFLVYHPAFGHFAHRFGLEQLAFEEDGKAPSAKWMATLINRSKKLGIQTIFVQPSFASDSVQVIARSLDAEVVVLDPLAKDLRENIVRIARKIAGSFNPAPHDGSSADE